MQAAFFQFEASFQYEFNFLNEFYQNAIDFRPIPTIIRAVYFWCSLGFVILRTCAVLFSLASVNDESKKPIEILRAVPSYQWNSELERFLNDVISDDIALSGMRFFFITRKLVLSVSNRYRIKEKFQNPKRFQHSRWQQPS